MTFAEWNGRNNFDGLNAGGAWDAALDEAVKICEGVDNFANPMTAQDCADMIRALKRPK